MQRDAVDVFRQRILFAEAALAHDARNQRGLGQTLLLDQRFERPEAAAASRDLEHSRRISFGVEDWPDAQTL